VIKGVNFVILCSVAVEISFSSDFTLVCSLCKEQLDFQTSTLRKIILHMQYYINNLSSKMLCFKFDLFSHREGDSIQIGKLRRDSTWRSNKVNFLSHEGSKVTLIYFCKYLTI